MIKEETFLAYQDQAEGLILDQAKLNADQKEIIEELRIALAFAIKTLAEIEQGRLN